MEKIINLAYTAGILDGEGTITLTKQHAVDRFRKPIVSVSSTTLSLLEFLKENYNGSISKHKVYQDHHKQSWSWKLSYDSAILFLVDVVPYMKEPEKIKRAQLIVNEYKQLTPRNGKYSKEQLSKKLNFEERFFHPSTSIG